MATQLSLACRLTVTAVIAFGRAGGVASAQATNQRSTTTPASAVAAAGVPIGAVVYVTDTTGATIKGKLAVVADDAVQVKIQRDVRSIAAIDVRRVQWQRPDSPLMGVLIGAGIGAIPGLYYLAVDPNECAGMCPEEYGLMAIGALVGGLIDHLITKRVTVYSIGPLVTRGRQGLQVAVKF